MNDLGCISAWFMLFRLLALAVTLHW